MKIQTLLFTALLGLAATAAFGATPAPAAGTGVGAPGPHGGMCVKNADECTQLAAKFDQWCQANAQKCTNLKAHIEKRREFCAQDEKRCREMMEHMRHHGPKGQERQGGDQDNSDGGNT